MKALRIGGLLLIGSFIAIYLLNASWLAPNPGDDRSVRLIAHRGVHQTYDRTNLGRDACTASRISAPSHTFLENTLPSMQAAFFAGADIVELDVHPTTDGRFAVFHDWTLDCRTDGTGVTRKHSLEDLKKLDIGYGYTADAGATYPLRGHGRGQMPSLAEVMQTFPNGRFLINFKSRDENEALQLSALMAENPTWQPRIWGVYGGSDPTRKMQQLRPNIRGFTKGDTKACLKDYVFLGWSGFVPSTCRHIQLLVPINYAKWMWGWPNRFLNRMETAGTDVVLTGAYEGKAHGAGGMDTHEDLLSVPKHFNGYIWTNKIEVIGPAIKGPLNAGSDASPD